MKNLYISLLLDFYGDMLTDKQKDIIDLYYNDDLSLAEIAQDCDITRQGVRDCIKRGEQQLINFEEKLQLAKKFSVIQSNLEKIAQCAKDIDYINGEYNGAKEIYTKADDIIKLVEEIRE